MKKNVSGQKIGCQMVSATDGSAFTSAVTVAVTLDAGTQGTGSVGSGACAHEGNGYHTYAPAQAETNGDLLAFTFTGSGAIPQTVQVYTSFPQTGDSFIRTYAKTTDITGFNDLSAAQVNAEADTALADYDAPTSAELVTEINSVQTDIAAVKVDTAAILVDTGTTLDLRIPAALVSGRMDASVGAMAAGVVTAAAVATGAIDADALAADAGTELAAAVLAAATANPIDANVQEVNDVALVGDGNITPWGPA